DSINAYVELGASVRASDDDLSKMVTTNARFSNMLGVSQKEIGGWQRAMMGIGLTAEQARGSLLKAADAMYKLGITSQQMSSLLSDQASKAAILNMLWGKEGTMAVTDMQNKMVGLGNALNLPNAQVEDMQKAMSTIYSDPNAVDYYKSIGKLSKQAADEIAKLPKEQQKAATDLARANNGLSTQLSQLSREYKATGGQGTTYLRMMNAFTGATHMSAQAADGFVRAQMRINETLKAGDAPIDIFSASAGDLGKALKTVEAAEDAAANKLTDSEKELYYYNKSISSVSKQFEQSWSDMKGAWIDAFNALKPGMLYLLNNVITPIIKAVSWFIKTLSGTVPPAQQAASAIDNVNKKAEPAVGIFTWICDKVSSLWSYFGSASKGAMLFAAGLGAIFAVFAGAAAAIAMWWLFMKVTDAPKLLAISLAAFAVGAGVLAIAFAIKMLADLDYGKLWSAVGALAVVFGLLALAVFGMSTGVGGAAAIALAGVLLAISVAAMITAGAVYVLSLAFENAVDSILKLAEVPALDLIALGAALIIFGGELVAAAVTIGIGGAAMIVSAAALGLGMGALSAAMFLLSDNAVEKVQTLGSGSLANFGRALEAAAPGVAAFIAAIGYGVEFAKGMGGFASGLSYVAAVDSVKLMAVSTAMLTLGKAMASLSSDTSNLSGVGSNITSLSSSLNGISGELTESIGNIAEAVLTNSYKMMFGSMIFGIATISIRAAASTLSNVASSIGSIVDSMSELRSADIIKTFNDLLSAIPTINSVTNAISLSIQTGQEKIKYQLAELKAAFVILESISNKAGIPIAEGSEKKKVMAETISTIQVKTDTAGNISKRWQQEEIQEKQLELMGVIAKAVSGLGIGNADNIDAIRGLLEEHLPKLGESPSKLGTNMNNWS
ncbi:MAG: hypothetical protein M0R50_11120, partial [Candidatus Cloacimonetes bacterium]|nr:hypothetical protein [Candidatus Cloacimonadota bacterium]